MPDISSLRNEILNYVSKHGPILPVQISKQINNNILFAGAILSELVANKKIIGYITLKDILKFKPSLFESLNEFHLIKEEAEKIERSKTAMKGNFIKGSCEECGNFDVLEEIDGRLICESCRDIM